MAASVKITDLLTRYVVRTEDDGTWVICKRCGERSLAGSAEAGADVGELAAWGGEHQCQPVLSPDAQARAGQALYEAMQGTDDQCAWYELPFGERDRWLRAFAAAIRAVALDLRACYEGGT